MIEILCSDTYSDVSLERPEGAPPRVRIGTQHSIAAILDAIGHQLSADEASACERLWADDHASREFTQTPEGMLFSLRQD